MPAEPFEVGLTCVLRIELHILELKKRNLR